MSMPVSPSRVVSLALGAVVTASLLLGTGGGVGAEPLPGTDRSATPSAAVTSLWSGTVQPGGTRTWHWNNAPVGRIYQVGLSPSGATTTTTCRFEVVKSWYETTHLGEREFYWRIENVGSLACGTHVVLTAVVADDDAHLGWLDPGHTYVTGTIDPSDDGKVSLIGASATGATRAADCRMRVSRLTYHSYQYRAERRTHIISRITNDATIGCDLTRLEGERPVAAQFSLGAFAIDQVKGFVWNNANPVMSAFVLEIQGTSRVGSECLFEVTRQYYRQRLNDGSPERELVFFVRRTDDLGTGGTCGANALLGVVS